MTEVQTYIQNLRHDDGDVRRLAALGLGAAKDPAVTPVLLDRIRVEAQSCVRDDLTWALVQHADEASDELLAMLRSAESADRRTAAHVLSKIGDPAHFEPLAPLVGDADSDVAIKAYRAVANTGHADAATTLATRLGDGDGLQRDALSTAMHRLGAAAVPPLVAALSHEAPEVREHAADALGYVGEAAGSAADGLLAATDDSDAEVRLAAVSALGQLGAAANDALSAVAAGGDRILAQVARRFLDAREPVAASA